jgi:hypothetical protein
VDDSELRLRIANELEKYRRAVEFLRSSLAAEEGAEEIVILVCARLDALASSRGGSDTGRLRFTHFVEEFSGEGGRLKKVSVPNLFWELALGEEFLSITVAAPGRLRYLDTEARFVRFVADSGVSLSEADIRQFLRWLSKTIQKQYRTTATQSKRKPSLTSRSHLVDHVSRALRGSRWKGLHDETIKAFKALAAEHSLSAILYRDIRSRSIHEHDFRASEQFFAKTEPFVEPMYSLWGRTRFLGIEFPGPWLVNLLEKTTHRYEEALVRSRQIPLAMWSDAELGDVDLLDARSVEDLHRVRLLVDR